MGKRVTYVGPFADGVEIYDTGQWVEHGKTVTVDDDLAGRPPQGEPHLLDEEGELVPNPDFDEGEGLLAQPANWQPGNWQPAESAGAEPEAEDQPEDQDEPEDDTGEGSEA